MSQEKLQDEERKCQDCGADYIFTGSQRESFAQKGYEPPKRCVPCRHKKAERNRGMIDEYGAIVGPIAEPIVEKRNGEEIRVLLVSGDFEKLVRREDVITTGMTGQRVRIVLADIGYEVMRRALESVNPERR